MFLDYFICFSKLQIRGLKANPFVPNIPFFSPCNHQKTIRFQGVEKGCIKNKWVKGIPAVEISSKDIKKGEKEVKFLIKANHVRDVHGQNFCFKILLIIYRAGDMLFSQSLVRDSCYSVKNRNLELPQFRTFSFSFELTSFYKIIVTAYENIINLNWKNKCLRRRWDGVWALKICLVTFRK